jgi:hypothetical protein
VKYIGSDPLLQGRDYELQGGSAWTPERFKVLKEMNKEGKVVVLTETGEKNLVKIGDLQAPPINRGY